MGLSTELTVRINSPHKKLKEDLKKNKCYIIESLNMRDYYMIKKDYDIKNKSSSEIISSCILVRESDGYGNCLINKLKEYDENGRLIRDGKVECKIVSIDDTISFMKSLGYKILFEIYDDIDVYYNGIFEFCVQRVNDKYIFIEFESEGHHDGKSYNSIEEMIKDFDSLSLDYDKSDYFVKKAKMILEEMR